MAMAGQVVLAIVIGLLIGSVLGLLIWKAWMVRHRKALRLAEQERSAAQYTQILDSLEVLCRAVDQKQVELIEAAIRISALLTACPQIFPRKWTWRRSINLQRPASSSTGERAVRA